MLERMVVHDEDDMERESCVGVMCVISIPKMTVPPEITGNV